MLPIPMRHDAVLFDVGGTLWPDGPLVPREFGLEARHLGLAQLIVLAAQRLEAQGLEPSVARRLAEDLADDAEERKSIEQATVGDVRAILDRDFQDVDVEAELVVDAMCLPAPEILSCFDGILDVVRQVKMSGRRTCVVSNTKWRSAARYRDDFATWGAVDLFDAYVTSFDVGFRKPHAAMFQSALHALNVAPSEAVMVGDSVANDIKPAKTLGMRTILVAFQQTPPADPGDADRTVVSVAELADALAELR